MNGRRLGLLASACALLACAFAFMRRKEAPLQAAADCAGAPAAPPSLLPAQAPPPANPLLPAAAQDPEACTGK